MTFQIEVIDVADAGRMFGLPETFFTTWCSDEAAKDFKSGRSSIPQLPHFAGKPRKVHIETFRSYLLKYHQVGGEGGRP